jgi:NDP-sugar pyrophosphorylase family protein
VSPTPSGRATALQVVILAGGLATRLSGVISGPKALVPVHGRPLLAHLIEYVRHEGADEVLVAAGHGAAAVEEYLAREPVGAGVRVSVEPGPLGTAGALRFALPQLQPTFGVLNGDTLLVGSLARLWKFHEDCRVEGTIAVVPGAGTDYGAVAAESVPGRVTRFLEKTGGGSFVSAGLAVLARPVIERLQAGPSSLERDVLPGLAQRGQLCCFPFERMYDVGTPERLRKADVEW